MAQEQRDTHLGGQGGNMGQAWKTPKMEKLEEKASGTMEQDPWQAVSSRAGSRLSEYNAGLSLREQRSTSRKGGGATLWKALRAWSSAFAIFADFTSLTPFTIIPFGLSVYQKSMDTFALDL